MLLSVDLILILKCIFKHLRWWGSSLGRGVAYSSHVQQVLRTWSNINYGNFLVFIRVIRSSVADGDESGSPCGYQVWCFAANSCSDILCCADSFYSPGHGGAFCFSPCNTTSLVCLFFCSIPLQHILACLKGISMAKFLLSLKRESAKFNSLIATEVHLFSYIKSMPC